MAKRMTKRCKDFGSSKTESAGITSHLKEPDLLRVRKNDVCFCCCAGVQIIYRMW